MCRSQTARICALSGALYALILVLAAPNAAGGQYVVGKCQGDRFNFSTSGIVDFATRGMRVRRACNPEGTGRRGLMVFNAPRAGRVRRGARASAAIVAPAGTTFVELRWAGQICRRSRGYSVALVAEGGTLSRPVALEKVSAGRGGLGCDKAVTAGVPRPKRYNVRGATRIVQAVRCAGTGRRASCSARRANWIRTFTAYVTVADGTAPSVGIVQDTPLARGEWVGGTQALNYEATDNVGVRLAHAFVGGLQVGSDARPCALADRQGTFAELIPCANGRRTISINTRGDRQIEGTHPLAVQAIDTAGNAAPSAPVTTRIDNTAPARTDVGVEGGQGWRNSNSFGLAWVNGPEDGPQGDRAPIVAATYRLCAAGGGQCSRDVRSGLNISRLNVSVPAPGQWSLSMFRRDAAGNEEEGNASAPVMLRYDPEPPQLGFETPSASDPTRLSVLVTDRYSGLAGGAIEVSRQGSGVWQTLPTAQEGTRLVARVDDARLPAGNYLARSRAVDQARNEASTDRHLDGRPMVLTLPLRVGSALRAGVAKKRTVRKTVKRRGTRRKVRRQVTVLDPVVRVRFGRRVQVLGRLQNSSGDAITGAPVAVFSRSRTAPKRLVGVVRTDGAGSFSYTAEASSSRTLHFIFGGSALILPAQREVKLLVGAPSTIRVSRRRALNGQAVTFGGQLRALPPPEGGKLVELQALVCVRGRGARCAAYRWQTFRTTRTDAGGLWQLRYPFTRTCGRQRFRFRARLPREAGYPFETGRSRVIAVRVRGRPCR